MSDPKKLSDLEADLVRLLRSASEKTLACISEQTHTNSKWQLVGAALVLRDRMRGISGGTVLIAPKALAPCIKEVEQIIEAADTENNGPHFDRVVIDANEAIALIDASDMALTKT